MKDDIKPAPPSELSALPPRIITLTTLWPQIASGAMFFVALVSAIQAPSPEGTVIAIGAFTVFLITLLYITAWRLGSAWGMMLLTWIGSVSLAIYSVLVSHVFLPLAIIFILSGVIYGLAVSDRRTMRTGAIIAGLLLFVLTGISELYRGGILHNTLNFSGSAMRGTLVLGIICVGADILQRLWRHFNRIEDALNSQKAANRELRNTQHLLERQIKERTTLLEVSRAVSSNLELQPLLDAILEHLNEVVAHAGASVLLVEGSRLRMLSSSGLMHPFVTDLDTTIIDAPHRRRVLVTKQPVIIDDVLADVDFMMALDLAFTERVRHEFAERSGSWLGVPLIVGGESIGLLSMLHETKGFYTPQHAELATAFANQVAVAISGARGKAEAIRLAALAERNRLARELHDSVSQALYGMSLGLRTAIHNLNISADQARPALAYSLDLAEAALAEMRALIFELRPESLKEQGLNVALRKQADAIVARHKLPIDLETAPDEPPITIDMKEALYRIGLEAIQNVVKHAGATRVHVRLKHSDKVVVLEVRDNGAGFDPKGNFPGHLGLKSMNERASLFGGWCLIDSARGAGTIVRVQMPIDQRSEVRDQISDVRYQSSETAIHQD